MIDLSQNGWSHDAVVDFLLSEQGRKQVQYRIDITREGVSRSSVNYTECSLYCDSTANVKYTGKMTTEDTSDIDFALDFLRPAMFFRKNGLLFDYPFVPLKPMTPAIQAEDGYSLFSIEAYDETYLLENNNLGEILTFQRGTSYTAAVLNALLGDGFRLVEIEHSPLAMTTYRQDWEITDNKLEVYNGLLEEINYTQLAPDRDGVIFSKPYTEPNPSMARIRYDSRKSPCVFPIKTIERDGWKRPNRFVGTAFNSNMDEPLEYVFVNEDPSSPTSAGRAGYTLTEVLDYGNVANRETLIALVHRHAEEAGRSYEYSTLPTAIMPYHELRDTVSVNSYGVNGVFEETGWSINNFGPSGTMTHQLRRIVYE